MATAQSVINRARDLINDTNVGFVAGLRWSDPDLLEWLTDGQREIVQLKPEANIVRDAFTVTGGHPRQRLDPSLAYKLIRVEANGTAAAQFNTTILQLDAQTPAVVGTSFNFLFNGSSSTAAFDATKSQMAIVVLAIRSSSLSLATSPTISLGGVAATVVTARATPPIGTGTIVLAVGTIPLQGTTPADATVSCSWSGTGLEGTISAYTLLVDYVDTSYNAFASEHFIQNVSAATLPPYDIPENGIGLVFGAHVYNVSGDDPHPIYHVSGVGTPYTMLPEGEESYNTFYAVSNNTARLVAGYRAPAAAVLDEAVTTQQPPELDFKLAIGLVLGPP